jgi:hypothetical protein
MRAISSSQSDQKVQFRKVPKMHLVGWLGGWGALLSSENGRWVPKMVLDDYSSWMKVHLIKQEFLYFMLKKIFFFKIYLFDIQVFFHAYIRRVFMKNLKKIIFSLCQNRVEIRFF